jgi:hypothetical protein
LKEMKNQTGKRLMASAALEKGPEYLLSMGVAVTFVVSAPASETDQDFGINVNSRR